MNPTITAVTGLQAGHYTDLANATGCTVVLCREGAVGGVDVRGGSPGTRETDLLRPVHRVERVHAILLSGGSAFGLDAAGGVVRYLEEQGIGLEVGPAVVPIVSGAILFDLGLINHKVRPGAEEGYRACLAAVADPMLEGSVGAGTGATVAKTGGRERAIKSGIGSASLKLPNGSTVSAVVAVNAYGGITDHRTGRLLAGPRRDDGVGFDDPVALLLEQDPDPESAELANTTIGIVATDAKLTKEEANYMARVSHDGLALTVRPCHTIRDGDTMFAMATGHLKNEGMPVDLTVLGAAAVEVTALAILRAVETAAGLGGLPSIRELSGRELSGRELSGRELAS